MSSDVEATPSLVDQVGDILNDAELGADDKAAKIKVLRAKGWLGVCSPLPLELTVKGCTVIISGAEVNGATLKLCIEALKDGDVIVPRGDFFIVNPPLMHEGKEDPLGALKSYLSWIVLRDA